MLRSMTGFGESSVETDQYALAIEIKTVNNRFLKVHSKVPEEISYLQTALEETIRRRLVRGSVSYIVRLEPAATTDLYEVDANLVKKYYHELDSIRGELGIEDAIRLDTLLALPGAVRTEETLSLGREQLEPIAVGVLEKALDDVITMRKREGANLLGDLRARAERLGELLSEIGGLAPKAAEEHFHRLEEKVRLLLGDKQTSFDGDDILKEAAIVAERSDINEELARFDSHLQQLDETLSADDAVGRKLEFIVQEMFRESNTMGSKAANSELNQFIVEMKAEVDRLKEQVLNIE